MNNKDHLKEVLYLAGLSTHRNMMHGTYNVKLCQFALHQKAFAISACFSLSFLNYIYPDFTV